MVKIYNQWIENICNLDEAHIQYLESSNGMDSKKMQQYLRNFGKVSSMEDIRRLKESTLFNKEINDLEVQNGWEHIDSKNISVMAKGIGLVKHRLYISCQNQDMWKLAQLFENKCEEQQLPFYFKLGVAAERDDKMVIYADTDNLANYINILQILMAIQISKQIFDTKDLMTLLLRLLFYVYHFNILIISCIAIKKQIKYQLKFYESLPDTSVKTKFTNLLYAQINNIYKYSGLIFLCLFVIFLK